MSSSALALHTLSKDTKASRVQGGTVQSKKQCRESQNNDILRNLVKKNTKVTPQRGGLLTLPLLSPLAILDDKNHFEMYFFQSFLSWFSQLFYLFLGSSSTAFILESTNFTDSRWLGCGLPVSVCGRVLYALVHVCSGCFIVFRLLQSKP